MRRRNGHKTGDRQIIFSAALLNKIRYLNRRHPGFLRLLAGVHLHKETRRRASHLNFVRESSRKFLPVEALNRIEQIQRGFDLVSLQRANQTQLNVRKLLPQRTPSLRCFLHPILTKQLVALVENRANSRLRLQFGNSDELDRTFCSATRSFCIPNARENFLQAQPTSSLISEHVQSLHKKRERAIARSPYSQINETLIRT